MIFFRESEEITTWLVAFHTRAATRWLERLVPGRFKHVSAFGYSPKARVWVFFNPQLSHSQIVVLPTGDEAETKIAEYTEFAAVLKIAARPSRMRFRPYVCCTSVVAHLLGLPGGALLPDRLWSKCLRNGAIVVHDADVFQSPASPAAARPGDCATAGAGAAEPHHVDAAEPV